MYEKSVIDRTKKITFKNGTFLYWITSKRTIHINRFNPFCYEVKVGVGRKHWSVSNVPRVGYCRPTTLLIEVGLTLRVGPERRQSARYANWRPSSPSGLRSPRVT